MIGTKMIKCCELSRHKSVTRIGLARELYSLAICILCGFIFGCVFVVKFNRTRELLAITTTGTRVWPTVEMASRIELQTKVHMKVRNHREHPY